MKTFVLPAGAIVTLPHHGCRIRLFDDAVFEASEEDVARLKEKAGYIIRDPAPSFGEIESEE